MIIDENVFDYGFEGRCPTKAQVTKVARIGMSSGASAVEIWWGEKRRINHHKAQLVRKL